jgi:hypothetical protein
MDSDALRVVPYRGLEDVTASTNEMLRRSQMTVEELQRALPRQSRGLWLVIFALIAIEAVARVIEKQRQIRMSCPDCFDFR